MLAAGLVVACLVAAWDVNQHWWTIPDQDDVNPIYPNDVCITWLREQYPERELAVWQYAYQGTTTFLNNRVRIYDILSDFEMLPLPNTLGKIDLSRSLPEFAAALNAGDPIYLYRQGYRPLYGSPTAPLLPELAEFFEPPLRPCIYRKADALPYAYTVGLATLDELEPPESNFHEFDKPNWTTIPPDEVTAVTTFVRQPDAISLLVQGAPDTVLTLQETAYPGWEVSIDGQPASIESVGGQIGVVLPADDAPHRVDFIFRSPLFSFGAVVTILSVLGIIAYLLRLDLWLKKWRGRR